jgi:16S rRNA C1402 N4-methylase RsmH
MRRVAEDRGYSWEKQRTDLVSRCENLDAGRRVAAQAAPSLEELFNALGEEHARKVIASALGGKDVAPFEMKGARQARILAGAIIEAEDIPGAFTLVMFRLSEWIEAGCARNTEIPMAGD